MAILTPARYLADFARFVAGKARAGAEAVIIASIVTVGLR